MKAFRELPDDYKKWLLSRRLRDTTRNLVQWFAQSLMASDGTGRSLDVGDHVEILEGPFAGEDGEIISISGDNVTIDLGPTGPVRCKARIVAKG